MNRAGASHVPIYRVEHDTFELGSDHCVCGEGVLAAGPQVPPGGRGRRHGAPSSSDSELFRA